MRCGQLKSHLALRRVSGDREVEMRAFAILTEVASGTKPSAAEHASVKQMAGTKSKSSCERKRSRSSSSVTRIKGVGSALQRLKAKPLVTGSPRVHELNVIFDTTDGSLAKRGQLLRIRTETTEPKRKKGPARKPTAGKQRVLVTFKRPTGEDEVSPAGRPASKYKVREEIELEISDGGTLTKIFEALSLRGWFQYEKYRTTYKLPGPRLGQRAC